MSDSPDPPPHADAPLILVAEDHDDSRMIALAALRHGGFRVLEAADGAEALQMARAHRPTLLLLDVSMPHVDGFRVASLLKQDPVTRDIRIVMLTAHALPEDRARATAAGVDRYLVKPLGPAALVQAVDAALGGPS